MMHIHGSFHLKNNDNSQNASKTIISNKKQTSSIIDVMAIIMIKLTLTLTLTISHNILTLTISHNILTIT
jgi:hypothetical protein